MVLSNHLIIDLKYEVFPGNIKQIMDDSIKKCNELTVINSYNHKFKPFGETIFYVLSQSHISIHTWPEYKTINLDIFTCGSPFNNTINEFLSNIKIQSMHKQEIQRYINIK